MLLDTLSRPLHDLRISVTDRCNFRCSYCMPEEIYGERYRFLPRPELLTFEEITRVSRVLVRMGVGKLRITGGEPLLRRDLPTLVGMLAAIDPALDMTLTTNGFLLARLAGPLQAAGLRRITVSLDALDDTVFRALNGNRSGVEPVLEGIAAAKRLGLAPIKINCVVKRGINETSLVDLAAWAREHGYVLRFIEYMDVGNRNGWRPDDVVTADEIVARIDAIFPLEPVERHYQAETALRYRYADGAGEIGVIASVTRPFCGACTRLRLSADGQLYTCLFGTRGTDIKTALRSGATDEALAARIADVWQTRADRYSEIRAAFTELSRRGPKVEMYAIGG